MDRTKKNPEVLLRKKKKKLRILIENFLNVTETYKLVKKECLDIQLVHCNAELTLVCTSLC